MLKASPRQRLAVYLDEHQPPVSTFQRLFVLIVLYFAMAVASLMLAVSLETAASINSRLMPKSKKRLTE